MSGARCRHAALVLLIVCVAGAVMFAQRGRNRRSSQLDVEVQGNTPYDGRFTFVRLRYGPPTTYVSQRIPWSHDYPAGERHFMQILNELSLLNPFTQETNILGFDDPELFRYPVAYMAEPGFWGVTPKEATALRSYLLKGGFLIFDDFRGPHWDNLQYQMKTVLPEANWIRLDGTARIFPSFFEIDHPEELPAPYGNLEPSYWGLFENNDPQKRLMVIANVNNDISEYWEFSGTGVSPVNLENESYKFGVNFVIYGLTH